MRVQPIYLSHANTFIRAWHRHSKPVVGHLYSLGVFDDDLIMHGVAITGRPVARALDDGQTVEIQGHARLPARYRLHRPHWQRMDDRRLPAKRHRPPPPRTRGGTPPRRRHHRPVRPADPPMATRPAPGHRRARDRQAERGSGSPRHLRRRVLRHKTWIPAVRDGLTVAVRAVTDEIRAIHQPVVAYADFAMTTGRRECSCGKSDCPTVRLCDQIDASAGVQR